MAEFSKVSHPQASDLEDVVELLGGKKVVRYELKNPLDVHEALLRGLPVTTLTHLLGNLVVLHSANSLEKAVGMSLRTIQRHKKMRVTKRLSQEQSGRTWKFAELLTKAKAVLGSQEEAEQWLERPALGLDQRRPIDLLATPAGAKIVEDFLDRLEFGVYT